MVGCVEGVKYLLEAVKSKFVLNKTISFAHKFTLVVYVLNYNSPHAYLSGRLTRFEHASSPACFGVPGKHGLIIPRFFNTFWDKEIQKLLEYINNAYFISIEHISMIRCRDFCFSNLGKSKMHISTYKILQPGLHMVC